MSEVINSEPVFIGNTWTLEVRKLENGKVAGYATHFTATTYPINDPSYSVPAGVSPLPKSVRRRLEQLMRKAGWVEDVFAKLRPEYMHEIAAKGDGRALPAEYADTSLARLYFLGDVNHPMYVKHYKHAKHAYDLWLGLPRGVRCAMRNAGELLPVYNHELVDRG